MNTVTTTPVKGKTARNPLPELYKVKVANKVLIINLGSEFNDTLWGAWFGALQFMIDTGQYQGELFDTCEVNFTKCEWADPLPLLSLSLLMVEYEQQGGELVIRLPPKPDIQALKDAAKFLRKHPECNTLRGDLREMHSDATHLEKQARILKFLAREGFYSIFQKPHRTYSSSLNDNASTLTVRNLYLGTRAADAGSKELLSLIQLPVTLAFERSGCVPATLLYLNLSDLNSTFQRIDQWVEWQLYNNIAQVVFEEVPSWAQEELKHRILNFLRETLHNVAEHAYADRPEGYAAVYLRYREGELGEDGTTWNKRKRFTLRESDVNKVPLMDAKGVDSFSKSRTGYFEIFVVDTGKGLCQSLEMDSVRAAENPLHQAMREVFVNGRTSKGDDRPTEYGGLYLLKELLSPNRDYFRICDEDVWWGAHLPLQDEQGKRESRRLTVGAYSADHGMEKIKGVAWTGRLSWLAAQDVSSAGVVWDYARDQDEQQPLREVFRNDIFTDSGTNIYFSDCRFSNYQTIAREAVTSTGVNGYAYLFLPRPQMMKSRVQEGLTQFLNHAGPTAASRLVIGDIPSEEAITYIAALKRANRLNKPPFDQLERVVLVTRELRACVLLRNSKRLFEADLKETRQFVVSTCTTEKAIDTSLACYLSKLRQLDGQLVKQSINKSGVGTLNGDFVREEVIWSKDKSLKGYLDFPQTLTHPLCRAVYLLSLQRLTGMSVNGCSLEGLDSLVDSLVVRFNAQVRPRIIEGESVATTMSVVHIGSVKVSGYTESAGRDTGNAAYHFFNHPGGEQSGPSLLPWGGPSPDEIGSHPVDLKPYERVGKSPVIARGGWRGYEIPRFDKQGECIYEKTPSDSYSAWQESSRSPMKLGHWVYGGHHEIITVNMMLAFNSELERTSMGLKGSLSKFTFANLFRVFGITRGQLNETSSRVWDSIKGDNYRIILPEKLREQNPLLVYPSHPVTDHIIDRFLSLLAPKHIDAVRDNIIAILPLRRNRSGSGLQISGITLENLKSKACRQSDRPVVYFDDGVITGRTYVEVKRLLRGIGYGDIYSLVLVDRQRLPSVHHLKNDRHVAYWRLDVPSIGGNSHCPLCHAIDKVRTLKDSITSTLHRERIEEWCESWKERDPNTQWGNAGLRPIPLDLSKPERNYCLRYNSGIGKYEAIDNIQLTNSAGLVAWVTELHTNTARDDYSLSLIDKNGQTFSPETKIQLLASQLLLFTSEFDADQEKKIALELLAALWDLKNPGRHSALAVLCLLSCVKRPLLLVEVFLEQPENPLWDQIPNQPTDFILFLALLACSQNTEEQSSSKKAQSQTVADRILKFENVNRLVKPKGKADLYYRLHREVMDVLGNAHSSPLHRFVAAKTEFCLDAQGEYANALAAGQQIHVVAQDIPGYWLQPGSQANKTHQKICEDIDSNVRKLRSCLTGMTAGDGAFGQAKETGKVILSLGQQLHKDLFFALGLEELKRGIGCPLLTKLEKLVVNAKRNISPDESRGLANFDTLFLQPELTDMEKMVINLDKKEMKEAFIVADGELISALSDIVTNGRWSSGKMTNPWESSGEENSDSPEAEQWIRLDLTRQYAKLEIRNQYDRSKLTLEDIKKKVKVSHSHLVISEIGEMVEYSSEENVLVTCIFLPFVHSLGSH